ncbi:winged helix-turn-helix transcriptional regulator [Candidatus Thorarchaeota archaeon]|nr:MAG: winged helix-turn-helix transcriptional regulator [Candidatus Thorarchaeota archaeon]
MVAWRAYDLDLKDYLIFLSLEKNPNLSNNAVGKEVGLSSEAVRLRRQHMKDEGFLRPDSIIEDPLLGNREQTETESVYNPSKLGLERQHVVFQGIRDRKALNNIKRVCDEHPYTHYRVMAYADGAAVYAQFDVPAAATTAMREFYNRIGKTELVESIFIQPTAFSSETKADFQNWDINESKWEIEYGTKSKTGERQSRVESIWVSFLNGWERKPLQAEKIERVHDFDLLDMQLLREITINSQPKIKALGDVYSRDPTTISRRLKRLKRLVAHDEVLYYDRSVFDLTYPQLIMGRFKSGSELDAASLHGFIQSEALPFLCKATFDEETFCLYLTTPPSFAPEFSEFIWEHASQVRVYQLQLDSSFTYYFYYKNHQGDRGWRIDREYLVDLPLQVL